MICNAYDSAIIFLYNGRDGVVTDSNGLLYMRARYYSPDLKRFVNADIIAGVITDPVTLNRYAYANGNPVSNIDPFGLSAERGNNLSLYDKLKKAFGSAFDWTVDTYKELTAKGYLDLPIFLFLRASKDKDGIYHIDNDWWQSTHFVGYNDLYDKAFDIGVGVTGGTVDYDNFIFTFEGKEYVIWVWKGDYINLGSGAEAGIYEESIIPGHWLTSKDNRLKMTLSLKEKNSNTTLFNYTPSSYQWWITGFDPSHQNAQASNLQSTVTIDFSGNQKLYEGFYNAYGTSNKKSPWIFDGMKATLIW